MSGLVIEDVRAEIDSLDGEIVRLISRRQRWVIEAGELIATVRALAEAAGRPPMLWSRHIER